VTEFRNHSAAEALAAANKRVSNILAKVEGSLPTTVDIGLLAEDAERALSHAINDAKEASETALMAGNYTAALSSLASLQEPVDTFFDNVMVNADDDAVRQNRLALLQNLRELFLQIADISVLN